MKTCFPYHIAPCLALILAQSAIADATDAKPTPAEYFGMHIHHADDRTTWPTIQFGSWRLWDAFVGWRHLEPKRGQWDFSRLDRDLTLAETHHTDVLLPLGVVPAWASARPSEASPYGPGASAEPASLDDWTDYVRAVGERYKGRIHYYEIWNEPSDKQFFTGTVAQLVDLSCRAAQTLKSIDPSIQVVSPASANGGRNIDFLDHFLAEGGKQCVDVVAHHFYAPHVGPEGMIPIIRAVKEVMRKNGIANKPLWNTETGWWMANREETSDDPSMIKQGWRKLDLNDESVAYPIRALSIARAEGIDRFFWYAWDNSEFGFIDAKDKTPKPVADAWTAARHTLLGKRVLACGNEGTRWHCDLEDKIGRKSVIRWTAPDTLVQRNGSRRPEIGNAGDVLPQEVSR